MASPQSDFQRALELTLTDVDKTVWESNSRLNPLYKTLESNFKSQDGGDGMEMDVILGREVAPKKSDNLGTWTPTLSPNVATTAKYEFEQPEIGQVTISFIELEKNKGKANRLKDRLALHKQLLVEEFHTALVEGFHKLHGDATRTFLSLDSLCNAGAATNVGGISTAKDINGALVVPGNANWEPVTKTTAGTDIEREFRLYKQQYMIRTGGLAPEVAHVGTDVWNAAIDYLNSKGQLQSLSGAGNVGWQSVVFNGIELRWDYQAPAKRAYFLHTPALHFRYLNNNFMKVTEAERISNIVAGAVAPTHTYSYPVLSILASGTNRRRTLGMLAFTGI